MARKDRKSWYAHQIRERLISETAARLEKNLPIIKALGAAAFGLSSPEDLVLWFGVLYLVNMQMSFLSPPFGYALFYLRGVAPPEIPMTDIFKSALPFLALQIVGLVLCMVFPEIITWLPRLIYG